MLMALLDTKRDCMHYAKLLGDYQSMSVEELANGYCEATDNHREIKRSAYLSALVLRFWYKINELYTKCSSLGNDRDEYFNWIVGAIELACKPEARQWQQNPKFKAQQIIMQILNTRFVAAAYYESNLGKHKANYNTMSLDAPINENQDSLGDIIPAEDDSPDKIKAIGFVQELINQNKLVEAVIMDCIAFKDVFKVEKHTVNEIDQITGEERKRIEQTASFWEYKLVKELNELTDDDLDYFLERYEVETNKAELAFNTIGSAVNSKKYKYVRDTLAGLKTNSDMLALLV